MALFLSAHSSLLPLPPSSIFHLSSLFPFTSSIYLYILDISLNPRSYARSYESISSSPMKTDPALNKVPSLLLFLMTPIPKNSSWTTKKFLPTNIHLTAVKVFPSGLQLPSPLTCFLEVYHTDAVVYSRIISTLMAPSMAPSNRGRFSVLANYYNVNFI